MAGESGAPPRFFTSIHSSFLSTPQNVIVSDLARRDLVVENSILAADGNVFELHSGPSSTAPPAIDLRSSTLVTGGQYFYFDPTTVPTPDRLRIFAENTIFGPPLNAISPSVSPSSQARLMCGCSDCSTTRSGYFSRIS